jgi:hypothetical protein
MVAFNFQKRWAPDVESGKKPQTIRKGPARAKVGDTLQLYTGQRTKSCRKLADAICTAVIPVRFNRYYFALDNKPIYDAALDKLAREDGFKDWETAVDFFFDKFDEEPDDFVGYLYKWRLVNEKKKPVRKSGNTPAAKNRATKKRTKSRDAKKNKGTAR